MPRPERFRIPNGTYLLSATGNNHQNVFLHPEDFLRFQIRMENFTKQLDCRIHNYVLLPWTYYLIVALSGKTYPDSLMRRLSLSHARYFNRKYGRQGHLWHERYRQVVIQPDQHVLTCGRYLEQLPVHQGLVNRPEDYPWSSAATWGWDVTSELLHPSDAYLELAQTRRQRRERYRNFLENIEAPTDLSRLAPEGVLGDQQYLHYVYKANADRTRPRPGRRSADAQADHNSP